LPNTLYMLIVKKLKEAIKANREGININDIDTGREWLKLSVLQMGAGHTIHSLFGFIITVY